MLYYSHNMPSKKQGKSKKRKMENKKKSLNMFKNIKS